MKLTDESPGHTKAPSEGPPLMLNTGDCGLASVLALAERGPQEVLARPDSVMFTSDPNPWPGFRQVALTVEPAATGQRSSTQRQNIGSA